MMQRWTKLMIGMVGLGALRPQITISCDPGNYGGYYWPTYSSDYVVVDDGCCYGDYYEDSWWDFDYWW